MKKIAIKLSALLFIILASCSSSDEATEPEEDNSIPTTYFPLKTANFWIYTIENRVSANAPASSATDRLTVGADEVRNAITYKKMETPTATTNGFFCSVLKDNGMRIDGTRLRVTGNLSATIIAGQPPINIAVNEFIILKDNAVSGALLSTVTGQSVQQISGYPVTFNYVLKSYGDGNLSTFTTNAIPPVSYTNVKKTKLVLTMTATTVDPTFGTVAVLSEQNVINSILHFVSGKGMIYNNRQFTYSLNPLVATQLGIPINSSQLQEEYLGTFDVSH